uniref:Uncharacterized protein n=1 Tax=Arundo donax TaxID=35708 RepID=A0A0A8YC84_ARUDO
MLLKNKDLGSFHVIHTLPSPYHVKKTYISLCQNVNRTSVIHIAACCVIYNRAMMKRNGEFRISTGCFYMHVYGPSQL